MEGRERPKKEADHSRWAGGRFNKHGNLRTRPVWDGHKMSGSPHQLPNFRNVYRGLSKFSHIYHPDSLSTTFLRQAVSRAASRNGEASRGTAPGQENE